MPSSYVERLLAVLDTEAIRAEEQKVREWEEEQSKKALDELAELYAKTPNPFHPKPKGEKRVPEMPRKEGKTRTAKKR